MRSACPTSARKAAWERVRRVTIHRCRSPTDHSPIASMAQEGDDELGCWRRLRALLLDDRPTPPFAIGCSEAGGFKIKSRERPSTVRSDASGFSNIGARLFLTWVAGCARASTTLHCKPVLRRDLDNLDRVFGDGA